MSKNSNITIKVPSKDPNYKIGMLTFFLLSTYVKRSKLQERRIERDLEKNGAQNLYVLFADIHFFLVSISNLKSMVEKLAVLYKEDKKLQELRQELLPRLNTLVEFRHHVEHLDHNRLEGKNRDGTSLKDPGMLGNLVGRNYNFGGEHFNLDKAFSLVDEVWEKILSWNKDREDFPLIDL